MTIAMIALVSSYASWYVEDSLQRAMSIAKLINWLKRKSRWLLLDSRVVGFADVIPLNCCHPCLLEALLFQWP
jgi:hypothetical protein